MITYRSQKADASSRLPQATLDYLVHGAPEGQRNAALFAAACQCRDTGMSPDETEGMLVSRAIRDGLSETEARTTIRSVFGKSPRGPATSAPSRPIVPPARPWPVIKPASPVPLPSPMEHGFLRLLEICFRPGEFVAIAPAQETEDGDIAPTRGVTLTREEWKAKATEKGGIERCFSTKLGLFVRVNPMRRDGARNDDVTAFRHALVEFDRDETGAPVPKEAQYATILASGLPVSVLIDSGNKSLHAWVRVDAPDAVEYKRRVDLIWAAFDGQALDKQNRNPSRLSRCPDGRRTVDGEVRVQKLLAVGFGASSWDEWEAEHGADALPKIISGPEFMAKMCPEPPQIIRNVLHQGCKMIIGGASKSRKSWSLMDMMLSVSSGVPWWGFQTQRGRVLYINFELPNFAFQNRLKSIAAAKGITNYSGLDLWNLRGYATDFSDLIPKILARIKEYSYSLIILDPVYKGLGRRDENKAGDIASLCNEIEQLAVQSGAAVVFGAHYSKGNQAGKEAIDRIGGSGVFARDPDVILTMTPHEEKDAYVVDLTLRALPQVEPFVVRWEGVQFHRDNTADPERLRNNSNASKPSKATYKMGSVAEQYGDLLEKMPPLRHDKDPALSDVIAYICSTVTAVEGECSLKEGQRIYYCMANMKRHAPIFFDRATRLWRGRKYRA
ncbi:MAG: AAA family ATPase [Chthoniobacteraceae bacterium]